MFTAVSVGKTRHFSFPIFPNFNTNNMNQPSENLNQNQEKKANKIRFKALRTNSFTRETVENYLLGVATYRARGGGIGLSSEHPCMRGYPLLRFPSLEAFYAPGGQYGELLMPMWWQLWHKSLKVAKLAHRSVCLNGDPRSRACYWHYSVLILLLSSPVPLKMGQITALTPSSASTNYQRMIYLRKVGLVTFNKVGKVSGWIPKPFAYQHIAPIHEEAIRLFDRYMAEWLGQDQELI